MPCRRKIYTSKMTISTRTMITISTAPWRTQLATALLYAVFHEVYCCVSNKCRQQYKPYSDGAALIQYNNNNNNNYNINRILGSCSHKAGIDNVTYTYTYYKIQLYLFYFKLDIAYSGENVTDTQKKRKMTIISTPTQTVNKTIYSHN